MKTTSDKLDMKHYLTLTLLAAALAAFGTTPALADSPQTQNRLSSQRDRDTRIDRTPTIALYANGLSGLP